MSLSLHPEWATILKYAWSVRFMAISGILSGVATGLTVAQPYLGINPILIAVIIAVFTIVASMLSILSIYARVVQQNGVP